MKYTNELNTILHLSRQEAQRLGNDLVGPEHLILGILRFGSGKGYELLSQSGVDLDAFKSAIDAQVRQAVPLQTEVPFSRTAERILRLTVIEAGYYDSDEAGSEHLLLSVLRERLNFPSIYLEREYNVTYESVEKLYPKQPKEFEDADIPEIQIEFGQQVLDKIKGFFKVEDGQPQKKKKENKKSYLSQYSRDLTELAREGNLDPVIGREQELERIVQILSRRKKNNPVLIGEPGVGKSAIVEALAQKIAAGQIPSMKDKHIMALDMASVVAGTTYRGQFEQRMKNIITELQERPDIILFIDEIHTIIGAGNAQGSLDAANILKPALARGEIQCIGATTIEEYRKSIEKDGALERRFQKLIVSPTTGEETLVILKRICKHYEQYHNVVYTAAALQACVSMSERYLTDRSFPDKAIDVMDEAGARKLARNSKSDTPLTVTDDDIAEVVSLMSGVPVQKVAQKETTRLLGMTDVLLHEVLGQDDAVNKVVRAIQRSRLGLRDQNRPIGTFFFLGPTGVGKTYLAQMLATQMFGSKDALIRFDMSEYMEKHAVSLMVGAPPGYVAHEEGGKLTEAVRRRPYSIVLFDEIEKAHQDIFNILLQVLDEGRLTDRQGRQVDFRNTIIILTSNVGTRQLRDFGAGVGFAASEGVSSQMASSTLLKALNKTFPPEFVNRIDDVILFNPLPKNVVADILNIEIERLSQRLKQQGHKLIVTDGVRQQLLEKAYDPQNGARPVRRAVQAGLEDYITDKLLHNPNQKTIKISNINIDK